MKSEFDFEPGEQCLYVEEGGIQLCTVLDRNLDDEVLTYKLRVDETLYAPGSFILHHEFQASVALEYINLGILWRMLELESEEAAVYREIARRKHQAATS